jgi:hypothetical protein
MSDQCALDANGKLKDASEIDLYESESDSKAIAAKPARKYSSLCFLSRKADRLY